MPSTPGGLSASAASPTQVNLSWSASSDTGGSGLAGYHIYRNGSHIDSTSATTFSNTGLAAGATYTYTVAAYDNAGNVSGQSNSASATTPVPLQATVNSTTWSWFHQVGTGTTIFPSTISVTASGGSGGYTYAWERVSGDTQTAVNSPASSTTKWNRTVSNYFTDYISVWRCRVSDSAGNTIYSPNVTVKFRAESLE